MYSKIPYLQIGWYQALYSGAVRIIKPKKIYEMKSKIKLMTTGIAVFSLLFLLQCSKDSYSETSDELKVVYAKADQLNFNASLKGRNEVPAVDSKGAGQVSVKISKDETSLSYKITAANLENVIQAHFHLAPAGSNGGVVAFLHGPIAQPSGPQNGVLAEGTITAASVIGALAGDFEALVQAIREGNIYVNVHTTANPSGELRGQL